VSTLAAAAQDSTTMIGRELKHTLRFPMMLIALILSTRPAASTIVAATMWSQASPCRRLSSPYPPPRLYPALLTVGHSPPGSAYPCGRPASPSTVTPT
jgi:hypothetical protein